jgi:periplasmic divalent cation tolerance protein
MSDVILIFCTCPDADEARRIAHELVTCRLAACVNILPSIESIYRWQGQVESAHEVLLLVKTLRERFSELQRRIIQLHSYDTPEIIAVPIADGLEKYLAWVGENV